MEAGWPAAMRRRWLVSGKGSSARQSREFSAVAHEAGPQWCPERAITRPCLSSIQIDWSSPFYVPPDPAPRACKPARRTPDRLTRPPRCPQPRVTSPAAAQRSEKPTAAPPAACLASRAAPPHVEMFRLFLRTETGSQLTLTADQLPDSEQHSRALRKALPGYLRDALHRRGRSFSCGRPDLTAAGLTWAGAGRECSRRHVRR